MDSLKVSEIIPDNWEGVQRNPDCSSCAKASETERHLRNREPSAPDEGTAGTGGRSGKVTFPGKGMMGQAWWHRPVISAPGSWAQEDHVLKASLGYTLSLT